jgi:regulator of sirC expression with transglutaminase-like and TPR domain
MTAEATDPLTEAFRAALEQGRAQDGELDLGEAALLMSALDRRGADLGPYRAHLADLARAARAHRDIAGAGSHGQILAAIMAHDFGYEGDGDHFENPDNANLLSVIDRRAGVAVMLGILYLHTARAAGWRASGAAFPGQFLVRIEGDDGVALIDPFDRGRELEQPDLYSLLRIAMGRMARLDDAHLDPVPDEVVLLRVLNNQKGAALRKRDRTRALELLDRVLLVAPNEAAALYEQAKLLTEEGRPSAARRKYEAVIALDPESPFAERSREDLAGIKRQLN